MTKMVNWIAAATLTLGVSTFLNAPAFADDRYDRYDRDYRDVRDWNDWSRDWRYDRDRGRYDRVYDRYDRDRDPRFARNVDREISLNEVPSRVRYTMDREIGRLQRRIERIWFVRRDGKEFYRVQVDRRGDDTLSFRISPDGRLLSVQEVDDRY